MKELSIKEKARAYDKIFDRAKKELDACGSQDCDAARQIYRLFPELAENKDKRIRGWLIDTIKSVPNDSIEWDVIDKSDVLAWLERQVEQKPDDKIEPSTFRDKLIELFKRFEWYCKDKTQTNGDIIEYVDAHIQELIDTTQKENKPKKGL